MRRPGPGGEDYEGVAFAPGQRTVVRETSWGDLPAVACLMAQPIGPALAHYDQGLVSPLAAAPHRAVSNFTSVKYAVESAGGNMWSLVSVDSPHRVLGFVSVTPGPGPLREHTGRCEVTCHDQYAGDTHCWSSASAGRADRPGAGRPCGNGRSGVNAKVLVSTEFKPKEINSWLT